MMNMVQPRLEALPPPAKVWNRLHATDRLAEEVQRAERQDNYEFSIFLVQFDGLSRLTYRLGHAPADDIWQRVLGTLVQDLRGGDLCCRLAGDEFLLILPALGQADCAMVIDRLHRRWNAAAGAREATIELNIGAASYPAQGTSREGLLAAADEAMNSDRLRNEQVRARFSEDSAMAA